MDRMIAMLSGIYPLPDEHMMHIRDRRDVVQFKPGQLIHLPAWMNGHGLAFLNKGVVSIQLQQPNHQNHGKMSILIDAGAFFVNKDTTLATDEGLQSLTQAELLLLDNRQCEILAHLIPQWNKMMDQLQIMILADRLERFKTQIAGTARLRYLHLIEHYPAIVQQLPLQQIAAYLGITIQSLSRIRNNLTYAR